MKRMAAELQKQITKLTDSVTICISKPLPSLENLAAEYKILLTHLTNQLVFACSSILQGYDFLEDIRQQPADVLQESKLNDFRFAIHSKNTESFLSHLNTFLKECRKMKITQKHLSFHLKKLLHVCFDNTSEKQLISKELEIDEYLSNAKNYEELELSLQFMFEQLLRNQMQNPNASSSPESMVELVKQYIRSNYGNDININDIARHFSITPTYLSRLFKKYTNIRPIEYLTNYRIRQACDYFSHSQLSVREVAELCGYSNQFYFSKAFKQITNVSPSEYRIHHQGEEEAETTT